MIETKMSILDLIEQLGKEIETVKKDCTGSVLHSLAPFEIFLKPLSEYLDLDPYFTLLFCTIFNESIDTGECSKDNFKNALNMDKYEILRLGEDFKFLIKNGYIQQQSTHKCKSFVFQIPKRILDNILTNTPVEYKKSIVSNIDLKLHIEFLNDLKSSFVFTSDDYLEEIYQLKNNNALDFLKEINNYELDKFEYAVALNLFCEHMENKPGIGISKIGDFLYDASNLKRIFRDSILNESHTLLINKIVKIVDGNFVTGFRISFEDNLLKLIRDIDDGNHFNLSTSHYLKNEDIIEKPLFYNDDLNETLEMLNTNLSPVSYNAISDRYKELNMKGGLTILMHGCAGTGKTESVYQLAKKHQRSIVMVNISTIRNKWVGESEKMIKQIFTEYNRVKSKSPQTPILLFNEADALISKRVAVECSTDQMQNNMQNVLLQELEDFDGILIATTNLLINIDKAFDRRFLFKLKFELPTLSTKLSIIKHKFTFISDNEINTLASEFSLSGGQIDNIVRKAMLYFATYGNNPNFSKIMDYAKAELNMYSTVSKIGF